jgi:hypothetical protein
MNHYQTPIDTTRADDRSVTGSLGYAPVNTLAGGSDKGAQFAKAARIDQNIDSLPGRQFATTVLTLNMLDTPAQKILFLNLPKSLDRLFHSLAHRNIL